MNNIRRVVLSPPVKVADWRNRMDSGTNVLARSLLGGSVIVDAMDKGTNLWEWVDRRLDNAQLGAGLVGVADPSPVVDGVNAGVSLIRGNVIDRFRPTGTPSRRLEHNLNAGASGVSIAPVVGDIIGKGGLLASKAPSMVSKAMKVLPKNTLANRTGFGIAGGVGAGVIKHMAGPPASPMVGGQSGNTASPPAGQGTGYRQSMNYRYGAGNSGLPKPKLAPAVKTPTRPSRALLKPKPPVASPIKPLG